jgi:hypothetical protein
MRWSLSALLAIGVLAVLDTAPAIAAPAGNFPFCIRGCDYGGGGVGDCSFTSYAQCQATASGQTASCYSNPYYNNAETPPVRGNYSRRRF